MHLTILTPERKVFEGKVRVITFPGVDGSFQMLDRHAPLVALLKAGVVEYKTEDAAKKIRITGGVVETLNNETTLLADGAEE